MKYALLAAALLLPLAASAQPRRWHDLTPDSLRGRSFSAVAYGYDGDRRILYAGVAPNFDQPEVNGLLRSDDGRSWRYVARGGVGHLAVAPENGRLLYATVGLGLLKTTDGGRSWADLTPALEAAFGNDLIASLTRVEISPHDTARVLVARSSLSGGLFFSDDGGRAFRYVNLGGGGEGADVNAVPSRVVPGRVYVAVEFTSSLSFRRVYVLDGWGRTVAGSFDSPLEIRDAAYSFLADADDVLYHNDFVSRDGGRSWMRSIQPDRYVRAVASRGQIAFGADSARYLSYDQGRSWNPLEGVSPGVGNLDVIDPADTTVFSATPRGLFAYARSGTVGTPSEPEPSASGLSARAYPNPFRSSLAVEVDSPSRSPLTVEAYDMMGRRVAVLADGTPGPLRLTWNGDRLAPGLYALRIRAGGDGRTLKITRLP